MSIILLGLNHKTAPVAVRERLAFPASKLERALASFPDASGGLSECVLVSTCNRVELYTRAADPTLGTALAQKFLCGFHGIRPEELNGSWYAHAGPKAVGHLFRVVSGLDSMVVGENEILSQVKSAYATAHRAQRTGKALNLLFQKSFKVAKTVRSETFLGRGAVSIGSIASELAERIFRSLGERTVLILGAGEMAELALIHLRERGVRSIIISNRSHDRAEALAQKFQAQALPFDDALSQIEKADIVVTAAACPHFLIHPESLKPLMRKRQGRLLFLIDIAVPRNIDPAVGMIENVFLYNIDDLQKIVETNLQERTRWIEKGDTLVGNEVEKFMRLYEDALKYTPAQTHGKP